MAVRDISHVELYTRDTVGTVRFLVSTMGFTRVADSVAVDRSSVLLRQGDVQIVVTSGWVTGRWLSEYGGGVADIAVTCDNVSEIARAALAAGAKVTRSLQGNPIISGWGGISHTLLSASTADAAVPPAGHKWMASPGAPAESVGRAHRLDHIAIRLETSGLADYTAFYTEVLGLAPLPVSRPVPGDEAASPVVVRSASERVVFALTTANADHRTGALPPSSDPERAVGAHRLAFLADDVLSGAREFQDRGTRGLCYQLVERSGAYGFSADDARLAAGTWSLVR
ncbi:4-hydroxyphenylpyruvate dioxygenase [Streptomyces goshikiensis]|uniref:4-hydroxyphenylpyruvate dioxygenase n=1 Tax=Streptomyces goshikiensis TaxID=1942 RepID=UPI00364B7408